jgi:hypothetical protein
VGMAVYSSVWYGLLNTWLDGVFIVLISCIPVSVWWNMFRWSLRYYLVIRKLWRVEYTEIWVARGNKFSQSRHQRIYVK